MRIIGITGGVGSGKSRVLLYLEKKYGATICQADHVAWQLQMPGTVCYRSIVDWFGEGILNADATINRTKLGQIVFADAASLARLNAIMHPAVKEEIRHRIQREAEQGTEFFVLEAALLIEENYDEICDELWYIYSSESVRIQRLRESRVYSDEKIRDMMSKQLSEAVFREKCDRVIDNNGMFSVTEEQIQTILEKYR